MKVLFITSWYPREDNPISGIFVQEIAKAVSKKDDVYVLYAYGDKNVKGFFEKQRVEEGGLHVIRVRYKKILLVPYLIYLCCIIKIFSELRDEIKPDIIHSHVFKSALPALLLKKAYNLPLVVTEHADVVDRYRRGYLQKIKNNISRILCKFSFNQADIITVPSSVFREYLQSLGITGEIKVIPNIVDTNIFYPKKRDEKDVKNILFVGTLTPVKGVDNILKAFKKVLHKQKNVRLDIVGDGNKKRYEKLAKSLNILDYVKFHGAKSQKDIACFMQECDFLILPSLYETFGIVLIEAMACGRPVISTTKGGPKDIINDKRGLLVPPEDEIKLAEAINYMLDNLDRYDSEQISRYITENFGYEKVGGKFHETYLLVLSQ